jgi:hypothetical protein
VTTTKDPVIVAKVLVKFAEQNDKLKISGGVLDGEALPASGVSALAKLPSREVLLAQLLGLLQAPASQLLRTIQEPGRRSYGSSGRSKRRSRNSRVHPRGSETRTGPVAASPTEGGAVSWQMFHVSR